jgi:general secretion pathway protein M
MSEAPNPTRPAKRGRGLALLVYAIAIMTCAAIAWLGLASLEAGYVQLSAARHLLARMELAGHPVSPSGSEGASSIQGSPFLEGETVSIAEAALQQRVGSAVAAAGGNVLSSQIEPIGNDGKKEYLTLIASCEIDQQSLQSLLYDLEAGMPFLFIDQLVLQSPQALGSQEAGRLRLLISVSGRWQGTK